MKTVWNVMRLTVMVTMTVSFLAACDGRGVTPFEARTAKLGDATPNVKGEVQGQQPTGSKADDQGRIESPQVSPTQNAPTLPPPTVSGGGTTQGASAQGFNESGALAVIQNLISKENAELAKVIVGADVLATLVAEGQVALTAAVAIQLDKVKFLKINNVVIKYPGHQFGADAELLEDWTAASGKKLDTVSGVRAAALCEKADCKVVFFQIEFDVQGGQVSAVWQLQFTGRDYQVVKANVKTASFKDFFDEYSQKTDKDKKESSNKASAVPTSQATNESGSTSVGKSDLQKTNSAGEDSSAGGAKVDNDDAVKSSLGANAHDNHVAKQAALERPEIATKPAVAVSTTKSLYSAYDNQVAKQAAHDEALEASVRKSVAATQGGYGASNKTYTNQVERQATLERSRSDAHANHVFKQAHADRAGEIAGRRTVMDAHDTQVMKQAQFDEATEKAKKTGRMVIAQPKK